VAARAHDAHRTLPAIAAQVDLEGDEFADAGTDTVPREGGDVREDFLGAQRRLDETESAIVIPLGQRAMGAHERSFLAVWSVASRWQGMFRLHIGAVKLTEAPSPLAKAFVCELTRLTADVGSVSACLGRYRTDRLAVFSRLSSDTSPRRPA
jgi:hypothetical protein